MFKMLAVVFALAVSVFAEEDRFAVAPVNVKKISVEKQQHYTGYPDSGSRVANIHEFDEGGYRTS
ncbi:MAG: hypothetical protein Q8L24_00340, partial [bacterium]|nr:hypothetical protein [bacterium]